jgi:hypothetical protein
MSQAGTPESAVAKKAFVSAPWRAPNLAKLHVLERELEMFRTRRRLLKRSEFRVYVVALRRLQRAIKPSGCGLEASA